MKRASSIVGIDAVALDFVPSGLLFDDADRALYIVDAHRPRILRWSDADGLRTFVELAAEYGSSRLGQIARWRNRGFLVPRHGNGSSGAIVLFGEQEGAQLYGLDPTKKRTGISVAPDGAIFCVSFRNCHEGGTGTLALISESGGEWEVARDFDKPIAVLATDAAVFVSDQNKSAIVRVEREGFSARAWASVDAPDALCAGPEGSIFACTAGGIAVCAREGGAIEVLAEGLKKPRGIAYDATLARLFIAESFESTGTIRVEKLNADPST